jgi:hypothetical protein
MPRAHGRAVIYRTLVFVIFGLFRVTCFRYRI